METAADTSNPTPKKKRSKLAWWLSILAILLAAICWFQLIHQQKRATHNYSQLQSSFTRNQMDNATLSQQFDLLKTQLDQQQQTISALQAGMARLQNLNNHHALDQALQEIDHNIQEANLALLFTHNVNAALNLLQYADQRLAQFSEPELIPLRQSLAKSIVALQAVPKVDEIGILSQLSALRDQTSVLPLFALNDKIAEFKNKPSLDSTPNNATLLAKTWQKSLETLQSLVIIRHRTHNIEPLVLPVQEQFLRQNLQMILQQAQTAVLQHDNKLYQFSLNQASEWLQRYFADNNTGTQALLKSIKVLSQQDIDPPLPNLIPLLNQVHQVELDISKSRNAFTADAGTTAAVAPPVAQPPVIIAQPPAPQQTMPLLPPTTKKPEAETIPPQQQLAPPAKPEASKGALV